jgi:hypothetical protein
MARTAAEMVTLIDETIEKIVAQPNQSYSILGRNFNRHNLTELRKLRQDYARQSSVASHGCRSAPDLS